MAVFFDTVNLPSFRNAVVTIGTFDGVHKGHAIILKEVVRHAAEVEGESILITFEPHPRKLLFPDKPLKLITPLQQKLNLVLDTGIDHIVVMPFTQEFSNMSAKDYVENFLARQFKPSVIVIGYDHHFGHDRAGDISLLKQYEQSSGFKVYEIPAQLIDEAAVSSTQVRNALTEGRVADVAPMLGRPYSLYGKVISGAQLGRTISYPTANILPSDHEQLIPANGVYAVLVKWQGKEYKAMLNIGYRPTVSKDIQLHIEAHIFDFDKDIYGEHLDVLFVERLRDEQKFPSIDALKAQLDADKQNALAVLNR
ncbi:MAG: bifunctional riboflavin kinase/FAD synthetase [Sphingobacteriales bacterium]|nr:MAG: bifunctional riboflavin kinase/FAD synthetase [Sphingobacteriales bacterium]